MPTEVGTTLLQIFMKRLRLLFALVFLTLQFASPIRVAAEESADGKQTKERGSKEDGPKSGFEIFGELLGNLAWPLVALVALYQLKDPTVALLGALVEKVKSAQNVKFSDVFELKSNSTEEFKKASHELGIPAAVIGQPDMFRLICKASNKVLSKSTKVMNLPNGCLVQVSTKEVGASGDITVAEAIAFVPGINMEVPAPDELAGGAKVRFAKLPDA